MNEKGNCLLAEKLRAQYVIQENYTTKVGSALLSSMYISLDTFLIGPTGGIMHF